MAVHVPAQRTPALAHAHIPFWQAVPPEQMVSHPPQFALSVSTFTQAPPQDICSLGHGLHTPPRQTSPAGHVFPQAPQLEESVCVSTHPFGEFGQ